MKRRLTLAAALLAAACVLPAAAQQGEPWKISVFLPITGANAGYSQDFKLGYEVAVEEINRKGGIKGRPIALNMADTQSNPGQVAALIRQACNEALIVSSTLSQESQVAFPVANSMQCPAFASATAAAGLTAANRPWGYSILTPSNVSTPLAINAVLGVVKPKKAAVVIQKADNASNLYGEASVKALTDGKVQVAETLTVGANDVDFGPLMSRIAAAQPDLIVISTLDRPAIGMLKEIRKAQYKGTVMVTQSAYSVLWNDQPPELSEGVYRYAQADLASDPDPRVKDFIKAYESKTNGRPPTFNAALPYDVIMVSKEAIEKGNLSGAAANRADDRKKFTEALNGMKNYKGLTGTMTMTKDGFMQATPLVLQFRKGKWVRVG
ncbi:ABC transporter substrate-binding protein [Ramlibacter sp.]|uniref:ABC transporter substrate-binding protein n=1 Tax=Ramlibacter sp. TaxID=1917967 RepID=UPI003D0A25F3